MLEKGEKFLALKRVVIVAGRLTIAAVGVNLCSSEYQSFHFVATFNGTEAVSEYYEFDALSSLAI